MNAWRRALVTGIALVAITTAGRPARADALATCKSASDEGQTLRSQGKLRAARDRFIVCAAVSCPPAIRNTCIRDFEDIERTQPTVVVRARDARGQDVVGVRVRVDGELVLNDLTGISVAVDPGPHVFRYEAAGGDAREETVLVVQGERDRVLRVDFPTQLRPDGRAADAPASPTPRSGPGPAPETPTPSPRAKPWPWIVTAGAVGAVGVVGFGVLQNSAWSEYDELRAGGCGTTRACDTDGIRSKLIVADVALGVGVIGLGIAAVLALVQVTGGTTAARPSLHF